MRMRSLLAAAIAATAALSSIAISATPPAVEAAGTAPVCTFVNSNLRYCNRVVNPAGTRGSIGLVGDSVLLGSANGASNPGLPTLLAQQGWSQISLVATLGMRTYTSTNNPGGDQWIKQWGLAGFRPDVIAVNLGVNHLGTCTPANTTPCENQIRTLLTTAYAAMGPSGVVWWAKIQHRSYPSGLPSAGMLGWNLALDRVAATQPRLVLWDWPANTSGIRLDLGGVHPVSGAEYVKRSTRMAADITARMPAARQGTNVPLPAAGTATNYEPIDEVVVHDTRADGVPPLANGAVAEIDLSGVAAGATSVALTVSAANATHAGFLRVYACDGAAPTTSAVNFAVARQASAQVLSKVSATGTVCVLNVQGDASVPKTVDVVVSVEGWFGASATDRFTPITPVRAYTGIVNGAAPAPTLRPTDVIVNLPTAPADATATAVILTTLAAAGESTTTAHRCGTTPGTNPDVSVLLGDTTAGASYVPITPGALGEPATICVHLSSPTTPPVVIVDVMGWFRPGVGLQFAPTTPTRLADTRTTIGPWRPRLGPQQVVDIVAGVPGAQAVSGTLTLVTPLRANDFTAFNCTGSPPNTSAVNARALGVAANNITVGLRADNRTLCVRSKAFSHIVFDVVGYWMVAA